MPEQWYEIEQKRIRSLYQHLVTVHHEGYNLTAHMEADSVFVDGYHAGLHVGSLFSYTENHA